MFPIARSRSPHAEGYGPVPIDEPPALAAVAARPSCLERVRQQSREMGVSIRDRTAQALGPRLDAARDTVFAVGRQLRDPNRLAGAMWLCYKGALSGAVVTSVLMSQFSEPGSAAQRAGHACFAASMPQLLMSMVVGQLIERIPPAG